jgi:ribonuclease HI
LLLHEEEVGGIDGVRVCRNAPSVSHLLFADDSLILMKADMTNATSLQNVLDTYCANSGQMVSLAKSSIFFSPNTNALLRSEICTMLHIDTEALSDKYLGLPALVGADRSDCFKHFIERIIQRINGWKEKLLSLGGKEILLKAVAQAIPVYAMSVFQLPKGICKGMMDAISQFWWGDDENSKKMHWMAWWKLCYPKKEGGMGFRDFQSFNLAMLAKQGWRLINDPESLCARVLGAKYYPSGDILKAGPKAGSSFTWQSILAGLTTFKRGYIWRVGNGEKIKIWEDPWIPSSANRRILTPRGGAIYTRVSELLCPITGQWDETLLNGLFNPIDVTRILQIPISTQGFEDFISWHFTKHGQYTVRSGYHLQWRHQFGPSTGQLAIPSVSALNPVWKTLWQLKIPAKVKIFAWRALHGIIPLKAILANRHIGTSGSCPVCNLDAEDIRHLLFTCPAATIVWQNLGLSQIIDDVLLEDRAGSAVLEYILNKQNNDLEGFTLFGVKEVVLVACWYLWWLRRQRTHDEPTPPVYKCKMSILAMTANAAKVGTNKAQVITVKWSKPEVRQVKVNVDASFHADSCSGAIGAVIRDVKGDFIAASTNYIPHVASAMVAEALAMKEGIGLAHRMGCSRVVAESDSLEVIQACNGEQRWWNEASAIFADCVDAAINLDSISFTHCPRESNEVAHSLARFCFDVKSDCTWVDEPPSFLLQPLLDDVTIL